MNKKIEFKAGTRIRYEYVKLILDAIEDKTWWMVTEQDEDVVTIVEDRIFKITRIGYLK